MREIHHFIDGVAVTGTSGRYGNVFNPNTGDVQARVQLATAGEVDRAVQSALAAQIGWAQVNPQRRARVMFDFKRLIVIGFRGNAWSSCSQRATAMAS